jgi:LacI family transcriptional regulator
MASARRPTMRDVAQEADVSFKTVSRVVNGESGVSAELADRVAAAISTLGYRPDQRARDLRQSRTRSATIGFVLPDVANPFFGNVFRGIEEVASARGCLVLAGSTDGSEQREHQLIEAFVERRLHGLIVVPIETATVLRAEIERGTRVVFVDLEPDLETFDLVRSDHYAGALTATRHLQDRGHVDIAYYGDKPEGFSARLRLAGYTDAVEGSGQTRRPEWVATGSHTENEWREIIGEHLRQHPEITALVSAQNYVTLGAAHALRDLGRRDHIAQVAFDDVDLADLVVPGISVIPQQPRDLGRRAAEILFARIDGDDSAPIEEIMSSAIIERGSGEIPPSR